MTIREVIEMLTAIFNFLMEYFGDFFAGLGGEAEGETPEAEEPTV